MIAQWKLCLHGPSEDASRALAEARARLTFAKKARATSEDIAERTRAAEKRNHLAQAVRYQLRGNQP